MANSIKINKDTVVKKNSFYTLSDAELWIGEQQAVIEECESKKDKLNPIYYKVTVYINS